MLLALVSMTDSITSFPLSFRTVITMASLCRSIPIVSRVPDYAEYAGQEALIFEKCRPCVAC